MKKLFSNTTALITLAIGGVATLVILVVLISLPQGDLVETPNTPKESWQRRLEIQKEGEMVRVVNPHDGYAVTVPVAWQVPNIASGVSGLSIFYHPLGFAQEGVDVPEGLFLRISKLPIPEDLTVEEWARQNMGAEQVLSGSLGNYSGQTFSQPLKERNEYLQLVSVENSRQEVFLLTHETSLFLVSCSATGSDYLAWIALCKQYAESLELL